MDSQLEQYYKWRIVSIFVIVIIFLVIYRYPKIFTSIGVYGMAAAFLLVMTVIYYFQYKSGYIPMGMYGYNRGAILI